MPAVPDMQTLLANPEIKGVILTVPNEQHLPLAEMVAKAGKHVYTEKPIAQTLEDGLKIEALEKQYGITVTVGHSARLMAGIRIIKETIDNGELGRVAFMEANFSNERALELTPQTWRWYKDRAPGGPLSQLAIHQFDVLHYLGGEIIEVSSMAVQALAGRRRGRRPVDDADPVRRRQDRLRRFMLDVARHFRRARVRLQGPDALRNRFRHLGHADKLHTTSTLYIQRGKDGYGKREEIKVPESDMFRAELEMFADSCVTGKPGELTAHNGNVAVAMMYAALRSIEQQGRAVKIADIVNETRNEIASRRLTMLPSRYFIDLTQPEIAAQFKKKSAGDPAGRQRRAARPASADRHRHLREPMSSATRWPSAWTAWCCRATPLGVTPMHMPFEGTITLTTDTYQRVVVETCVSTASTARSIC